MKIIKIKDLPNELPSNSQFNAHYPVGTVFSVTQQDEGAYWLNDPKIHAAIESLLNKGFPIWEEEMHCFKEIKEGHE